MAKKFMLTLIALSALIFSACGGGTPAADPVFDEPGITDPVAPEADPIAPLDDPGMTDEGIAVPETDDGMAMPGDAGTIPVQLNTMDIQMPDSVPMGTVEFQITNANDVEYNFVIEGPGMMAELPGELAPGETDMLVIDVEPGEYTVYSFPADQPDQVTIATFFVAG